MGTSYKTASIKELTKVPLTILDKDEKNGTAIESKTISCAETVYFQQLQYPKRIFLILGNEFCERFMYLGVIGKHSQII